MTDTLLKEEKDVPASTQLSDSVGVGGTLRAMRESRRISLSEASQRLKYSVRQIEALESEHWDRLPSGMPLRGFVRNYARYLEADVDSILVLLDKQAGTSPPSRVVVAPGVTTTSIQGDAEVPMAAEPPARSSWGWFLIILAILLVAAFYAVDRGWVPESWLIFDWLKAIANNE